MKKKFRLPSAIVILFLIIIVIGILTWVIPAGQYDYAEDAAGNLKPVAGTYHQVEANPQGVGDILLAPINGFIDGIEVITFILVVGGFLGIIMKTGAINKGISRLIRRLNHKEKWLIPILMILFGIGGSTYGMAEETLAFYPILLPAFYSAGYNNLTAVSVILIGAGLGVIGSTTNPFATGIASGFANISMGEGIGLRLLILILLETLGIIFVMRYGEKHKKPLAEVEAEQQQVEDHPLTTKEKVVLTLFALTFLVMIYAVIPFEDMGITFLPTLGWWFTELAALFLVAAIIIGRAFGLIENDTVEAFFAGAADMLGVVFIIGVSRGITVIMNDGLITDTILHYGEELLANTGSVSFTLLSYILYLPLSFLVPSTSGLATLSTPILAPMAEFAGVSRALLVTIFQCASGLINLITPTSAVVMGALAFGKIPYEKWIKFISIFFLIIFVLLGVLLVAASLLGG